MVGARAANELNFVALELGRINKCVKKLSSSQRAANERCVLVRLDRLINESKN